MTKSKQILSFPCGVEFHTYFLLGGLFKTWYLYLVIGNGFKPFMLNIEKKGQKRNLH